MNNFWGLFHKTFYFVIYGQIAVTVLMTGFESTTSCGRSTRSANSATTKHWFRKRPPCQQCHYHCEQCHCNCQQCPKVLNVSFLPDSCRPTTRWAETGRLWTSFCGSRNTARAATFSRALTRRSAPTATSASSITRTEATCPRRASRIS